MMQTMKKGAKAVEVTIKDYLMVLNRVAITYSQEL